MLHRIKVIDHLCQRHSLPQRQQRSIALGQIFHLVMPTRCPHSHPLGQKNQPMRGKLLVNDMGDLMHQQFVQAVTTVLPIQIGSDNSRTGVTALPNHPVNEVNVNFALGLLIKPGGSLGSSIVYNFDQIRQIPISGRSADGVNYAAGSVGRYPGCIFFRRRYVLGIKNS